MILSKSIDVDDWEKSSLKDIQVKSWKAMSYLEEAHGFLFLSS